MGSILLLPLVARCLETIDTCIWRMFVFMSVVVQPTELESHAFYHPIWPPTRRYVSGDNLNPHIIITV